MMPEKGFQEIIHRAIINYEFIRAHAGPHGPFETTQLLATMHQVVGWPNEKRLFPLAMTRMSFEDAKKFGFPEFGVVSDTTDYQPTNLSDMLWMLRNAIAHANIEFHSDGDQIEEIVFSDKRSRDGARRTTVRIKVRDVEAALYAIRDMVDYHLGPLGTRTA